MSTSIETWIEHDRWPSDYYEMLGLRRFERDRETALKTTRRFLRALIPFQSHPILGTAQRAIHLQMELAKAENVFRDPEKLAKYDAELAGKLRDEYFASGGSAWSVRELRAWLKNDKQVFPDRIDAILRLFSSPHIKSTAFDFGDTHQTSSSKQENSASQNVSADPAHSSAAGRVSIAATAPVASDNAKRQVDRDGPSPPHRAVPQRPNSEASEAAPIRRVFGSSPTQNRVTATPAHPAVVPAVRPMVPRLISKADSSTEARIEELAPLVLVAEPTRPWMRVLAVGVGVIGLLIALNVIVLLLRLSAASPRVELQGKWASLPSMNPEVNRKAAATQDVPTKPAVMPVPPQPSRRLTGEPESAPPALPAPVPPPTVETTAVPARTFPPLSPSLNRRGRGADLLVVSEEGQAALLVGNEWRHLPMAMRVPKKIMWTLSDSQGTFWFAGEGGLARVTGDQIETWGVADGLPDAPLGHVYEDSRRRIWVGSWGGGVALWESNRWRTLTTGDGLRHGDVNGCVEDAQGRIWIAGSAGMLVGGRGVTLFTDGAIEQGGIGEQLVLNVMSIDGDDKGRVFLGCVGGLFIIHPNLVYKRIDTSNGLPQKTPQATFVDSQGRVWVGTWGGGVVRVDSSNYEVAEKDRLAEANHVRRFAEDDQGTIWVGSLQGLWKHVSDRWEKTPTPAPIEKIAVVAAVPHIVTRKLLTSSGDRLPAGGQSVSDTRSGDNRLRGRITSYGIYQFQHTRTVPREGTSGQVGIIASNAVHVETTRRIPCRVGIHFGFTYSCSNLPQGRPYVYRSEMHHPPIQQPDGSILTKSVTEETIQPGETPDGAEMWGFLEGFEYELVPGQWTRKVFIDDELIVSLAFDVVKEP